MKKLALFISGAILCLFTYHAIEKLLHFNNETNKASTLQVQKKEKSNLFSKHQSQSFKVEKGIVNIHKKKKTFLASILIKEKKLVEQAERGDNPDLAFNQDFERTKNLDSNRPTPEVLPGIIMNNTIKQFSNALMGLPGSGNYTSWYQRGPSNVGGRTRAIAWDPNDITGKKVWAGGVTGGLWYNNDITDANSAWVNVGDLWANLSITKIAFDPANTQNIYVATGEGYQVNSSRGAGIWKSTDAGATWTQLNATIGMTYINDLVVRSESGVGVVYAAVDDNYYNGDWSTSYYNGLYRSANGGATWAQVMKTNDLPNGTNDAYTISSISVASDGRIWVGTKATPLPFADKGGGRILYSTDGINWNIAKEVAVTNGRGRTTVATTPIDANYIYAFVEKNTTSSGSTLSLIKSTDKGLTWTDMSLPVDADVDILSSDFTRGQAWYDQVIKVDPNNPQILYVGGINLFKSTDAGATWTQISKWSDNPGMGSIARLSYVHADQHAMEFKPNSSTTALFGNDGGVFYSSNLNNASTTSVFAARNNNYNVTQFYAGAMHPSSGINYYLAGAQDNGTQQFSNAGLGATIQVTGGDGAYCFIDQLNPSYQITSYVYNNIYRSTDGGVSFNQIAYDGNSGSFINPACYDNNLHIYYSFKSSDGTNGVLKRISGVNTNSLSIDNVTITGLSSSITTFKVSSYTTTSTTLFIGTSTGKIIKVTNANGTPTSNVLSTTGLPAGSISSIDIGANENELLVTFFNYGVNKIWYTSNGGTSWSNKMGNFPNIPARWGLFNPNNRSNDVILATELGIYGTSNFSNSSPTWSQLNNGFANVRTDMLQYRSSDNQVIAITHGRGLYSSMGFSNTPTITSFTPTTASPGTTVTISGTNFTGATSVSFGGVAASSYTVTTPNTITALVGSGASGNVSVTTPGGEALRVGFVFCVPSSATLSSGVNSNNQIVCQNTSISNITYATTNITGGTSTGLPPGLTASLSSNVVTISGSPNTAGTYNYTLNLTGGCQTIVVSGTMTVTASNTLTLSSAAGTNAQAACINNPIANITYTTTGATGATVTGLPTGVTKTWVSNVLTISGTPTVAGVFTYTINLSGGCSSVTTLGTITVSTNSIAGTASASSSTICSGNSTSLTLTGNTGSIAWQQSSNGTTGWANVNAGIGSTTSTYTTPALSSSTYYRALITNGGCTSVASNNLTITVNQTPAAPDVVFIITCKDVSPITLSATATAENNLLWYGTNETGGTGVANANIANTSSVGIFNYYVSQISALGCESPRSKLPVTVYSYPSTPVITRDGSSNLVSSNSYGNKWYKDLVLITDTAQTIKPSAAGNYTVLTTQNYCVSKMSAPYYYVNSITDVVNLNMNEFIKVYPNPIVSELKVDFNLNEYSKLNIGVYNATTGAKVIELNGKTTGSSIDVSGLPAGTYIVIVSSNNNQLYYKEKIMKL